MSIYADVVFLINLIMDYLIFWTVSKLLHNRCRWWRILAGAFVSAFAYCFLIFYFNKYYNFFSGLFILMLGVGISFGIKSLGNFLKALAYAHVAAFAIGGFGMALFYYTNITGLVGEMLDFSMEYFSLKLLLTTICLSFILIKSGFYVFNHIFMKKRTIYGIKIITGEKKAELSVLADTGNSLVDPVSKEPVIIVEFDSVKQFLPEKMRLLFCENQTLNMTDIFADPEVMAGYKLRIIPFKSIGSPDGMLVGFKPDVVELFKDGRNYICRNAIIGVYNIRLSEKGDYQGLLNPSLINMINI